jgi:hypothetical protein
MVAVFPLLGFWKYRCQSYFTTDGWQPISSSWRQAPWDPRPVFFFQPNTCGHSPFVTSTLTRGCRLQLLLVFASAVILRSESHGTHDHILLSQIRDSPNLEGQVHVFISPRNRVAQLYPRQWVPFSSSPTTRRATEEVFEPASTSGKIVLMLTFTKICPVPWKHLERSNVMRIALTNIFLLKVKFERSTTNDEVRGRGKYAE